MSEQSKVTLFVVHLFAILVTNLCFESHRATTNATAIPTVGPSQDNTQSSSEFDALRQQILDAWNKQTLPRTWKKQFKGRWSRYGDNGIVHDISEGEEWCLNNEYFLSKFHRFDSTNPEAQPSVPLDEQYPYQVEIYNPNYHAFLDGKQDSRFVLSSVIDKSEISGNLQATEAAQRYHKFQNTTLRNWNGVMLSIRWDRLLQSSGFSITGVDKTTWQGQGVTKLKFEYDSSQNDEGHQHPSYHVSHLDISNGTVYLLHQHGFLPIRWTCTVGPLDNPNEQFDWEYILGYEPGPANRLVLNELSGTCRKHGTDQLVVKTWGKFAYDFSPDFTSKDFTLAAFNIPEPSWYRPPPPYWLYVSLGGMALVIVGAVLIRYGKHLWRKG